MKQIIVGNSLEKLKDLPDGSIDCVVTSPPYYGLRDYGTGKWVGGDPNCPHRRVSKYSEKTITGHHQKELAGNVGDAIYKTVCPLCGAVRVDEQIGLEETPQQFIDNLVKVFRECKRILKDDGTLWVNIGDSYWGSGSRGYDFTGKLTEASQIQGGNKGTINLSNIPKLVGNVDGYKNKDLIGIPWMLAFALRDDGWYLRQDIIWHKPNPMPESVKDRCVKSHEYIFLLSKKPHYYFDYEAIQEEASNGMQKPATENSASKYLSIEQESSVRQGMNKDRGNNIVAIRKHLPSQSQFVALMKRNTTVQILSEHTGIPRTTIEHWFRADESGFAFPSVEDWVEIRDFIDDWTEDFREIDYGMTEVTYESDAICKNSNGKRNKRDVWSITTKPNKEAHFATFPEDLIEPCILAGCPKGGTVLDPFCGSGTTGIVSVRNERNFIGIELNPEYAEMSERRISREESFGIQTDMFGDINTERRTE